MNAFTSVRPRGKDMPAALPKRKTTNTSAISNFGSVKTLDSKGRQTVSLKPRVLGAISIEPRVLGAISIEPRVLGAISIEPREQAIASRDKRDAIKRGMSQ